MIKKFADQVYRLLRSRWCLWVIVGLFAIQAIWMACVMQYPLAFDESYHLGIIEVYSHQWLPFITVEPAHASGFGDITRYDSYLYHYLMSFPFRAFAVFTHEFVARVIFMRLLNVGIFIGGIVLFSRLLQQIGLSRSTTNITLAGFVLIPVVPFLAATINYDNLVFLLVPAFSMAALSCSRLLIKGTPPPVSLIICLSLGMLGCLVKYAFAPLFIGALMWLFILWLRIPEKRRLCRNILTDFFAKRRQLQIILALLLLVSGGLFCERYGVNIIKYHTFQPDCSDVQPLKECLTYGPWARNYKLAEKVAKTNPSIDPPIMQYPLTWVTQSMRTLYFAVDNDFHEFSPLPLPIALGWIFGISGLVLTIVFWRALLRDHPHRLLFIIMIVFYTAGLFYVNFSEYMRYRTPVAINGRYLIIILPLFMAFVTLAFGQLFHHAAMRRFANVTPFIACLIFLIMLDGGGASTRLVYSQPHWYWGNKSLRDVNMEIKHLASPLIFR